MRMTNLQPYRQTLFFKQHVALCSVLYMKCIGHSGIDQILFTVVSMHF